MPRTVKEQSQKTLMKRKKSLREKLRPRLLRLRQSKSKIKLMQARLRSLQPNASVRWVTNLAHFNRVKSQLASGPAPPRKTLAPIGLTSTTRPFKTLVA